MGAEGWESGSGPHCSGVKLSSLLELAACCPQNPLNPPRPMAGGIGVGQSFRCSHMQTRSPPVLHWAGLQVTPNTAAVHPSKPKYIPPCVVVLILLGPTQDCSDSTGL